MKKGVLKKGMVVLVLAGLVALFFAFDLGQYLTLEYLKASQQRFNVLYAEHPVLVVAGYMVIYILVTSLSLPGAAIMTIAGGALFGLVAGTLAVSFASSIGATLAAFVARFLLRDWVVKRFGAQISRVDRGLSESGLSYLLFLHPEQYGRISIVAEIAFGYETIGVEDALRHAYVIDENEALL